MALIASGCGGSSYVLLEVTSELSVPAEVDGLEIITTDPDSDRVLAEVQIELASDQTFPVDVLLEVADSVPSIIREKITATHAGDAISRVAVEHNWTEGRTTVVNLPALRAVP